LVYVMDYLRHEGGNCSGKITIFLNLPGCNICLGSTVTIPQAEI